jgi:Coenzyme PQQ synthesis protein D (PqqD)
MGEGDMAHSADEASGTIDPASIEQSAIPTLSPDIAFRQTDGKVAAFDQKSGAMFEFNETASSFVTRCDGRKSLHEIATELASEYDVTANDIIGDLREIAAQMADQGVLTFRA